jgi:hypothetical protein
MDSKAFHICPFCQATSPVADARCASCARSLAGLTLPVYGSEIDEALSGREPQPLVDLPLREDAPVAAAAPLVTAAPVAAAEAVAPIESGPETRPLPLPERTVAAAAAPHRSSAGRIAGTAAAMLAIGIVGGWLVRGPKPRRGGNSAPLAAASAAPSSSLPAAPPSTFTSDSLPSMRESDLPPAIAPRVTPRATPRPAMARPAPTPMPPMAAPPRPASRPDTQRAANTAPARPAPQAPPVVSEAPPVRRAASRPVRPPAAEPIEEEGPVPPDVDMDSVAPERGDEGAGQARTSVADRLQRAEERRATLAARVNRLRERVNVGVIRDVENHQRLQAELEAALDQQDRLDSQIARLRRLLDRGR